MANLEIGKEIKTELDQLSANIVSEIQVARSIKLQKDGELALFQGLVLMNIRKYHNKQIILDKQDEIEILKEKEIDNIKSTYFLKIKEYFKDCENKTVKIFC